MQGRIWVAPEGTPLPTAEDPNGEWLEITKTQEIKPSAFEETPMRDSLVWAICNWLLRHVASREYGAFIDGSICLGIRAAADKSIFEQLTSDEAAE